MVKLNMNIKTNICLLLVSALSVVSLSHSGVQQEGMLDEVRLFAGDFAPRGWKLCDGQALQINDHTALYAIIGGIYGGDKKSTFLLPDLRGRVPAGAGKAVALSQIRIGQQFGRETLTLGVANMPSHSHSVILSGSEVVRTPTVAAPVAGQSASANLVHRSDPNVLESSNSGGSVPVRIAQPSLGMHYIICVSGVFPSRG
ncbi:MAG: microcystin-dependent protein [Paracoccaceae bacterium]|jgi:microcystin-dependent protein